MQPLSHNHLIMKLSPIQYNALMIAINQAKTSKLLYDPYSSDTPIGYTEEKLKEALDQAETIIFKVNNPF